MQVNAVASHHVMPVFGIDEEVGMRSGIDACTQESYRMLGNARGVHSADDDFQPSFQIAGFGFQIPTFKYFQSMTGPPATPTLKRSG